MLARSSLQYSKDWPALLRRLAASVTTSLYVTRVPIVFESPSFVVVQRPYAYRYDTEYLGWVLNRDELLDAARANGMILRREFLLSTGAHKPIGAPEATHERGFLFQPDLSKSPPPLPAD